MLFIFMYFLIMILLMFKNTILLNTYNVDILKANINNSYTATVPSSPCIAKKEKISPFGSIF
jgi:hypothetical protein